VTELFN